MKKRIDERLPKEIGEGVFPNHAAIASPWGKLVSFQEAAHYAARYSAVISAAIMQAYRILVPDYVERSKVYVQMHINDCMAHFPVRMPRQR